MYLKKLTIFIIYNQYNIWLSLDPICKNPCQAVATLLNTFVSVEVPIFLETKLTLWQRSQIKTISN